MTGKECLTYSSVLENPTLIESTFFILDSNLTITSPHFSLITDKIIVVKPPSSVLRTLTIISESLDPVLSYNEVIFKKHSKIFIKLNSTVEITDYRISTDLHLIEELNLENNDQKSLTLDSTRVYLFGKIFKEKQDFLERSWAGFFLYVTDQVISAKSKPLKNFSTVDEYIASNRLSPDEKEDMMLYFRNVPSILELMCSDKFQIKSGRLIDLKKIQDMVWVKSLCVLKKKIAESQIENFSLNEIFGNSSDFFKEDLKTLLRKIKTSLKPENKETLISLINKETSFSEKNEFQETISYRNINLVFSERQRTRRYEKFIINYSSLMRDNAEIEQYKNISLLEKESDFIVYIKVPFSLISNCDALKEVVKNISNFLSDQKNVYILLSNISSLDSIKYIENYLDLFNSNIVIDHFSSFLVNDQPDWKSKFCHQELRPTHLLDILKRLPKAIILDSTNIHQNLNADIVIINSDISVKRSSPTIINASYIIVESLDFVTLTIIDNSPEFRLPNIKKIIGMSKIKILFKTKDLVRFIRPLFRAFEEDPNYYLVESLRIDSMLYLDLVVYVNDNFGRILIPSDLDLAVKNTNIQFSFFLRGTDNSSAAIKSDRYFSYLDRGDESEVISKYLINFPSIFELLLTNKEYFQNTSDFRKIQEILLSNFRELVNCLNDYLNKKREKLPDVMASVLNGHLRDFLKSLGIYHRGNSLSPFLNNIENEGEKINVIFNAFCYLFYLDPTLLKEFRVTGFDLNFMSKRVREYKENNRQLCIKLKELYYFIDHSELKAKSKPKPIIKRSRTNDYIDEVFWVNAYNL